MKNTVCAATMTPFAGTLCGTLCGHPLWAPSGLDFSTPGVKARFAVPGAVLGPSGLDFGPLGGTARFSALGALLEPSG